MTYEEYQKRSSELRARLYRGEDFDYAAKQSVLLDEYSKALSTGLQIFVGVAVILSASAVLWLVLWHEPVQTHR